MKCAGICRRRWLTVCTLLVAVGLGGMIWQAAIGQDRKASADPQAVAQAKSLSRAFRAAAQVVQPTVVKISISTKPRRVELPGRELPRRNPFKGTPFEDFFDENDLPFPDFRFREFTPPRHGVGSGVIINPSGIILTNNHVVKGADEVLIELANGDQYTATDIKTDARTDLAVLRIKADKPLPAATLGNSDKMEIGDWVLAVGNPFDLAGTVSAGIISSKGRSLRTGGRARFLQTDAAINPGNSGGPLVNLDGEVVGINTAIASNTGGYQGIGFAIPVNLAKWVTAQLISKGSVQRAYLGVQIGKIDARLARKLGVEPNRGVLVSDVFADSPAEAAGFQEGDVILAFSDQPINETADLQRIVERAAAGSKQRVDVIRDGKPKTLQVVVEPMPNDFDIASAPSPGGERREDSSNSKRSEMLGLEVGELTKDLAERLGYKGFSGVLITEVDGAGVAGMAGIREGMLILRVGKKAVRSVAEFEAALKDENLKDGVLLLIRTAARKRFVVLQSS